MSAPAQDEELEPAGPGKLTLLRPIVLMSLLRHRWLLLAGLVLGVVFGLFRGLVTANQFRSIGKLYVRPGVREAMSADTVLSGGHFIDPAQGLDGAYDIAVFDGRVAAVLRAQELPACHQDPNREASCAGPADREDLRRGGKSPRQL